MFSPEFFIDVVQSTKRTVTNTVITDQTLNKAAHKYIDAQTAFAKMLVGNAITVAKYSLDSISSVLFPKKEQATQAPYKVEPKTRKTKVEKVADTDINTQGE